MKRTKTDVIKEIAERMLFLETLEERGLDRLDFHDMGVVAIKAALEAAYEAGYEAGALARKGKQ